VAVDLSLIRGQYLRDILCQPQALRDTLSSLLDAESLEKLGQKLRKGSFQRVILTGMGASFHALYPLTLLLVGHGVTALMVEASELVHFQRRLLDSKTLLIALSQSGESAEIIRLLDINRRRSALIGITNSPESSLAHRADAVVLTRAGQEFSVSCKTYVTALMALQWTGAGLLSSGHRRSQRELARAAEATSKYLSHWENHVETLAVELRNIRRVLLVGRGASLAAAETGALIIKESDHFDAEGMSSAALRHGPIEMVAPETFVLVFAGDSKVSALNRKLFEDIRKVGRAGLVGEKGSLPAFSFATAAAVRPILEILPAQMITLALAALAGREPGKFVMGEKVTTTE